MSASNPSPSASTATAPTHRFDVVIVGSGLAGLSAALLLPSHLKVAILTKRSISDGSSGWAQGGIAAVLSDDDSFESHVQDTFVARRPRATRARPASRSSTRPSDRLAARDGHAVHAARR